MIDGINISHHAPQNSHLLGFDFWEIVVNEKTLHKVSDRRHVRFRALDLQLKPSKYEGFVFIINGSIHKYYNEGLHNADQFTFSKLEQSIYSLCDITGITPNEYELHGLEIGVNIKLPFSVGKLLKNLVCFGINPFTQINKKEAAKGLQCARDRYTLKVYDKAKQSGEDCGNVLRFEVSVNKMQALEKYGLCTFADLQQAEKVYPLIEVLQDAMGKIIFTDTAADLNKMPDREAKQWLYYSNPRSWQNMTNRQKKYSRQKWKILLSKYGNLPDLLSLLKDTWNGLFEADKLYHLHQPKENQKQFEIVPNAPFICSVQMGHKESEKMPPLQSGNNANVNDAKVKIQPPPIGHRFCISCGKEITLQKVNSRFCSLRFVGKAQARKCRNIDSNERKKKEKKILKALAEQKMIEITCIGIGGEIHIETLQPSEIVISRQWLDRVQSITIQSH